MKPFVAILLILGCAVTAQATDLVLMGEVWDAANAEQRAWLPGYVRAKFEETVLLLREIGLNTPANAWDAYQGTLTLNIHRTYDWGYAGEHTILGAKGFDNPMVQDRIDISWDLEMDRRGEVLAHELRHFLAWHSGDPYSGEIGHGTANDAIVRYLKRWIGGIYHGDIHLRHVRDLQTDL